MRLRAPSACLRAPSARLACCQHSAALRRSSSWAFTPPPVPALAVLGSDALFPVNNVYCVGRNYSEHAREMRLRRSQRVHHLSEIQHLGAHSERRGPC